MGANTQYMKRRIVGSPKTWGSVVLISQCQAPPGRLISDGPMPDPHNKTPTRRNNGKSPAQLIAEALGWTPALPYVGNLRAYGCAAFVFDHDVTRSQKFAPRGNKGFLVGYEGTNIYRVWFPSTDKVVRSTNVTFDETTFFKGSQTAVQEPMHTATFQDIVQYELPNAYPEQLVFHEPQPQPQPPQA